MRANREFQSNPQSHPYRRPSPRLKRSKSMKTRPSRGQSTPSHPKPPSPSTFSYECWGVKHLPQPIFQSNIPALGNIGCDTMAMAVGKERLIRDPPRGSEPMAIDGKKGSIMLSPPLSPPSPRIPSVSPTSATPKPAASELEIPPGHPSCSSPSHKTYEDYVRGLTVSDLNDKLRLDKIRQELLHQCGHKVDLQTLKIDVHRQSRQVLLASWKNQPLDENSLGAYQRRLMIEDIDNSIRLLEVPR